MTTDVVVFKGRHSCGQPRKRHEIAPQTFSSQQHDKKPLGLTQAEASWFYEPARLCGLGRDRFPFCPCYIHRRGEARRSSRIARHTTDCRKHESLTTRYMQMLASAIGIPGFPISDGMQLCFFCDYPNPAASPVSLTQQREDASRLHCFSALADSWTSVRIGTHLLGLLGRSVTQGGIG